MKPTLLWKLYLLFCYGIFYAFEYNFTVLWYSILFTITIYILLFHPIFQKRLNFLLPPIRINLVWIIVILILLLLIAYLQKKHFYEHNQNKIQYLEIDDYLKIKAYQYGFTIYANFIIKKVIYPGMYFGELRIQDIKKYYKNKDSLNVSVEEFKDKVALLAVGLNKKDLWENCSLDIFFYGKVFFFPIEPKSSFYEYLLKNNARFYLRLQEKNIRMVECNKTLEVEIKSEVIHTIKSFIKNSHLQGILIGLLLGNSNWMDKETKDKIKKLGLLHLFAASGLHLGIIFYVFFYPFSKIWGKKHYLSYLLPIPFLFMYLYILNFPYTLVRAFIFVIIMGLLMIIHKKIYSFDLIINTLLIMILIFPMSVMNLSTFMSFMAVSGILFFFEELKNLFLPENRFPESHIRENLKYHIKKLIVIQFIITFSASIFFQPFIFYVFRGYSIFSPLYNMIFVPIISIFLPVLFFSVIISMVLKGFSFSLFFLECIWNFIEYFMNIILFFIEFFYTYVFWLNFNTNWNYGFFCSLIFVLYFLYFIFWSKNDKNQRKKRNCFLISYVLYQFSLGIYYLWNIHFSVK